MVVADVQERCNRRERYKMVSRSKRRNIAFILFVSLVEC